MEIANELVRHGLDSLRKKFGDIEVSYGNNQCRVDLPDGRRAVVKTGSKGQVMQRTHGTDLDARYTGVADTELVVIAVRNRPGDSIAVYAVPGDDYRKRMTKAYAELRKSKMKPSDLRVLRFDGKGYPEQRVAKEWARHQIEVANSPEKKAQNSNATIDGDEAIASAKSIVAEAFGVSVERVSISINM